jgi:hypothetical protein
MSPSSSESKNKPSKQHVPLKRQFHGTVSSATLVGVGVVVLVVLFVFL